MTVGTVVPCGAPWMGVPTPASGLVPPKSVASVSIPVNAAGLAAGSHVASACFNYRALPVRLTVTP